MNKKVKLILLIASFVGVIAIAGVGYNYLTKNYNTQDNYDTQDNTKTDQTEQKLQKAVDFAVLNKDGNTVNLSDNFGKPIVVNFWATWCGPCKMEMPEFNKLYKEYGNNITFMMVNLTDGYQDTVEKVNKYIDENGYEFPVYYDTKYSAARAYSVNSVPATLFINEKGEIEDGHLGAMNETTLKNYIVKLLGGTEK